MPIPVLTAIAPLLTGTARHSSDGDHLAKIKWMADEVR
jgi:hypothetical protein